MISLDLNSRSHEREFLHFVLVYISKQYSPEAQKWVQWIYAEWRSKIYKQFLRSLYIHIDTY